MKIKTKRTKTVILSYKIKLKHFEDFILLCSYDRSDIDRFVNLLSKVTEIDKEVFYNLPFPDLMRFVNELIDSIQSNMNKHPKAAIKVNDRYYKLIDLLNLPVAFFVDFDLVEKTPSYLLALCYTETGSYVDERNSNVDDREKVMQEADVVDYFQLANFFLVWKNFLEMIKKIERK